MHRGSALLECRYRSLDCALNRGVVSASFSASSRLENSRCAAKPDFTEKGAGHGETVGERRIDREALHVAEDGPVDPHQAARSLGGVERRGGVNAHVATPKSDCVAHSSIRFEDQLFSARGPDFQQRGLPQLVAEDPQSPDE